VTSLNDIPEDPRGFLILPETEDGEETGLWYWQRISDNEEVGGFSSREEAIAHAEGTPIRHETTKAGKARAMLK
jgi:hypothetical protein